MLSAHGELIESVSTHSSAEAAAKIKGFKSKAGKVSTHSRAEAAAFFSGFTNSIFTGVSTHSRAEAAAH